MCAVNIWGHEANFSEAEARWHQAEIEAEARKSETEAEWFGLEALTSLLFAWVNQNENNYIRNGQAMRFHLILMKDVILKCVG